MPADLVLRDVAELAGVWQVRGGGVDCTITLSVERVDSANAHRLADPQRCLARLLGQSVAGWRPAPDGLDFARADRLSAGFFAFEGAAAVLTRRGVRIVLTRTGAMRP